MTPSQRVREEIKRLHVHTEEEPLAKSQYISLYRHYQALSSADRQRILPALTQLRERMEDQLIAEKRVEELVQSSPKTMKQRHQTYTLVHAQFAKLSKQKQKAYYPTLIHLRRELERGR